MSATLKAERVSAGSNYHEVPVDDLSAGLDQRKAPTLLSSNRARVLRNWSLREPGALVVFPGWLTFSTASLGSGRPQGGQRIYLSSGAPFTLAAWNGGVYEPSDAGVWGAAVSSGWSAANELYFPYDRDLVAILDGATAAKKSTDGATWTNFGIAAPLAAPTDANLAGGTLVSGSVYEFSFSGRDDALLHESNESARVSHTPHAADSGALAITIVAAAGTFTRPAGSFLTDGFVVGMTIVSTGYANAGNNTTKVIQTVTALVITVTSVTGLVNEAGTGDERLVGNDLSVRLTIPFHPDTQVDTLVVYGRDTSAGETVRRRIGTVANPGSGTVTYDVTSNSWGSGTEAPSDHTVPPLLAFGLVWKNRWWARHATIKNRLHFTQIFEPQSWPADFFIDVPFERGDDLAAVVALGDTLLLFGQSKIFLIIGQTSLDFEVRPSGASQAGALGPRAVDVVEDGAIHAAADGIYLFDGATDRLLSFDVDAFAPTPIGWRKYITSASAADLARTPLTYHQAAKEVAIGVTNLYPFGTPGEWILDLNRTRVGQVPAWTTTDRPAGGYIRWDGNEPVAGNRGRLFSWSQTIGKLYEERTGTTADGADLVATYTGPTFAIGGRITRFIDGAMEFEPHGGTFGIELAVDSRSFGSQNVDISGSTSVYGTGVYGTATYGGAGRMRRPFTFPLEAEGLTANITGTYTGKEAFRWFTYMLGVNPESLGRGL